MRTRLLLASAGVILLATAGCEEPAPRTFLDLIPEQTLAFALVRDVRAATDEVDAMIRATDLGSFTEKAMPRGALNALRDEWELGPGFRAEGTMAVAWLDPSLFGEDPEESARRMAAETMGAPNEAGEAYLWPIVMYVPGATVEVVFPTRAVAQDGEHKKVRLWDREFLAAEKEGYVLLSERADALNAVQGSQVSVRTALTEAQRALMERCRAVAHVNVSYAAPMLREFLPAEAEEMRWAMSGPLDFPLFGVLNAIREGSPHLESMMVGVRRVETGTLGEALIDWKSDSPLGKAMAGLKPGPVLDRLPNLPYAMAMGTALPSDEHGRAVMTRQLHELVDENTDATDHPVTLRVKALLGELAGQVDQVQLVLGLAPPGPGAFGLAAVARCRDAQATRDLLAEAMWLTHQSFTQQELGEEMVLSYERGADSLDGLPVDHLTITEADPQSFEAELMRGLFGELAVRVRVVAPDEHTLVLTLGGGRAMLGEAVRACREGGGILRSPDAAESLEYMPHDPVAMMLISTGSFYDLMRRTMGAMMPAGGPAPEESLPFFLSARVPVALGQAVHGTTQETTLYVPDAVVRDIAGAVRAMEAQFGSYGEGVEDMPELPEGGGPEAWPPLPPGEVPPMELP
jgi:hypothetical protein